MFVSWASSVVKKVYNTSSLIFSCHLFPNMHCDCELLYVDSNPEFEAWVVFHIFELISYFFFLFLPINIQTNVAPAF